MATVLGDSHIDLASVAQELAHDEDGRQLTRWSYVALTDTGLVVLEAEKEATHWETGVSDDLGPQPTIGAVFVPLREVTFCGVTDIEQRGPQAWTVTWSIGIRNSDPLTLPALPGSGEDAADALGCAIRNRLAVTRG